MKRVASISFGKDSLATLLYIIDNGIPLDEVVFFDTGMEFQDIYNNLEKMRPILRDKGIKLTVLQPKKSFLYYMLEKPVSSNRKGKHFGYGWCGGVCRWGTTCKLKALDDYTKDADIVYIGIAADEPERLQRLKGNKYSLIAELRMSEVDCLNYCRQRGWNWNEETPVTKSGFIDLYDILDRVSCWCCCNKNKKELRNIFIYLPNYWEKLKALQSRIARPMKNYKNKEYGENAGNVFVLEKQFKKEIGAKMDEEAEE